MWVDSNSNLNLRTFYVTELNSAYWHFPIFLIYKVSKWKLNIERFKNPKISLKRELNCSTIYETACICTFYSYYVALIGRQWRTVNLQTTWTAHPHWSYQLQPRPCSDTQLSPTIILMSGGVHEGGILQSELFTRRSQNLVSGKLRSSGFWRYS